MDHWPFYWIVGEFYNTGIYMTRAEHRQQLKQLMDRLETQFIGGVYKALRSQYISFIRDLRAGGLSYAKSRLTLQIMNPLMGTAVEKIYRNAGVFMAQRTLSGLKKERMQTKYATFGFNAEWVNEILAYFRMYLLEKAVIAVSNTTRDRILAVLEKATAEGWSNDQIIAELNDLAEIRNRARMIVRTETVRAANYGVIIGADKYEYEVVKEWVSVPDNRRRHSHATVDGQKREVDQPFGNGLMFPGDPNGPAKETINCRCVLTMVAKRDSKGRLIPKKQPTAPIYQRLAA